MHELSDNECIKNWFYENHVEVVAQYAEEIVCKYGGNVELAVLGALFHDIANLLQFLHKRQ